MPFPFALPTTSSVALTDFYTSPTHPSLVLAATTQRSVVRDALKKHKRLPPSSQTANLTTITDALNGYIPYLIVLIESLRNTSLDVQVEELKPLEAEWRPTLSRNPVPGREVERAKVQGLHSELAFVLQTLGYIQTLHARAALFTLYASLPPSQEQRGSSIATAMKFLLEANSIHSLSFSVSSSAVNQAGAADIGPSSQQALASLALAEATLITVLKDDPYVSAVVEARSKDSKEWMIRAPSIPKVRAHLFARLCLASADHAAKASALLGQGAGRLDEAIIKYADDLRRTAKAKAARFLAIDAEAGGKTGEAIAWLRGARHTLGFTSATNISSDSRKGLKGLKQSWAEKREDKKVLKGDADAWGLDAGKLEEGRVVEWLEGKWAKENDAVGVQPIPAFEPLLAQMPTGREYHTPKQFVLPILERGSLESMRVAPKAGVQAFGGTELDSGDEDDVAGGVGPSDALPGAFPTAGRETPAYF